MSETPRRLFNRTSVLGLILGLGTGVFDTVTFKLMGVEMMVGDWDATLVVMGTYAFTIGVLGFFIGHLIVARRKIKADQQTIQAQLARLEQTQRQLVEHEKLAAIGRLSAGVAHEVRNPLGVIRTSASMLLEDLEPATDGYKACEFIREEVDRLNRFVTELLDFSRPLKPRLEPASMADIAARAAELAGPTLAERNVALDVDSAEAPVAPVDVDLLSRAVYGLVLNSAEAIDRDGRVALRWYAADGATGIEVADDGPGATEEARSTMFEPFFTTKTTGTGLGLAMAARVVDAHNGSITYVPNAGLGAGNAGACFRVALGRPAVGEPKAGQRPALQSARP